MLAVAMRTLSSNRILGSLASIACAVLLVSGCSKGDATGGPSAAADASQKTPAGPITDSADSGLKPVAGAKVAMGDPKHGGAIFGQNCSSCHGQAGAGGGIGPVLKGESKRKNYDQAIVWIKNPQLPMPKLYPSPLSESDVQDVAAYVETL